MQVKLRQVGNSIGLTIPASELKNISARTGDVIELEIKRVVRHVRAGWDDSKLWEGANEEPMLLEGLLEPTTEEWD